MHSCASLTISWTNIYSVLLLECKGAFHLQEMAGQIGQLYMQPINAAQLRAGARFSKVPKPFGRISGDIIHFVSSKRKRLEARNIAVILILFPLQHMKRSAFRISGSEFYEWLFGPEKFSGLSRNGPLPKLTLLLKDEQFAHEQLS